MGKVNFTLGGLGVNHKKDSTHDESDAAYYGSNRPASLDAKTNVPVNETNEKPTKHGGILLFIPALQMFWFDWLILIGVLGSLSYFIYWLYKNWSIEEEKEETVQIDQNLLISAPANETDEFEVYGRNGGEESSS